MSPNVPNFQIAPTIFLTNPQFLQRYDSRRVGNMVLDNYTQASATDLANPSTAAGLIVQQMIEDASEMILAAATVAARYSLGDLLAYGGNQLLRLTADLTWGLILTRRALATEDFKAQAPFYQGALDQLEALRRGERIFYGVPNVPEAGLPAIASTIPIPGLEPTLLTQQMVPFIGSTNRPTRGVPGSWA